MTKEEENKTDDGNYKMMDGYQSGNDHKLPFPKEIPTDIGASIENIMRDSAFRVDPNRKIEFKVCQTHDTVYTLRYVLKDYTIQEGVLYIISKKEPKRILWRCRRKK